MNPQQIQQLEKLAKVFNTSNVISPEDIAQVVKGIAQVIKIERENIKEISEEHKQTLQDVINTVSDEHDKVLAKVEKTSQGAVSEATDAVTKALEDVKRMCDEMMAMKPKDGEKGEDADEEKIVEEVLAKIKLPENKEFLLTGEDIVDNINSLSITPENQIDASHIKNLPEGFVGGGSTARNLYQLMDVSISAPTNNQVLKYNSTTNLWENGTGGGGSGNITSINADTTAAQLLVVGTSGTDFAIVDNGTGTHTFNLPTASATNRGALSSTDWTTFNSKFTLPSLTAGSVLFSDGSTIAQDNANFFWDNTNNRLGILTATPTYSLEVAGTFKSGTGSVIGTPSAGGTSLTVRSSTGDTTTSVLAVNDESNNNLFRVHSEASGSTKMSTALVLIDNTLRVGDKLQIAGQLFSVRTDQVTPADSKLTVKAGDANFGDRGGGDLDFQSGAGAGAGDGGAISFYTSLGIASSGVTNTQIKRASILPSGSVLIETPSSGVALDVRGSILCQKLVEANTAGSGSPNIITSTESGTVFTNEGTTAQNYHTLPTATAGLTYTFYVDDADGIRVTANAGDIIQINGVASTTAGYCESLTIGSSITLLAINATDWVATSSVGTWNLV